MPTNFFLGGWGRHQLPKSMKSRSLARYSLIWKRLMRYCRRGIYPVQIQWWLLAQIHGVHAWPHMKKSAASHQMQQRSNTAHRLKNAAQIPRRKDDIKSTHIKQTKRAYHPSKTDSQQHKVKKITETNHPTLIFINISKSSKY